MRSIALTGSMGSGKTTVLRMLRKAGVATIDCDAVVAELYGKKAVQKKLAGVFGSHSKGKIAEIVFKNSEKRGKIQRLLHPLVWREVQRLLGKFRAAGKKAVVTDVPLLFEAGWQKRFDGAIVVFAPKKQCLRRLQKKGVSRSMALARLRCQLPVRKKAAKAASFFSGQERRGRKKVKKALFVIDNSGSLRNTRAQANSLVTELKR
ncbi:MAG: dephospho-CoA kinase [Candidatus Diapherotrites archaeon]|nr:dephospho-CoA kinase [Candidatus Diapherotrites archaeon]